MKKMKRLFLVLFVCLMSLFAAQPVHAKTARVTLTLKAKAGKRPYYLAKGKQLKIRGSVGKKKYSGKKLTYVSSNNSVATVSSTGIVKARKKGTTIIRVYTRNGQYGAKLELHVTKDGITTSQRAMNYKSKTNYKILVNRGKHKIYIYQKKKGKWKCIKKFPCVVGAPGTETPTGSYVLKDKGYVFVTDTGAYCWYFYRIYKDICFHSQPYVADSSPNSVADPSMGVSVSHGCVRLYLNQAKWIWKHVPMKTRVVIYN